MKRRIGVAVCMALLAGVVALAPGIRASSQESTTLRIAIKGYENNLTPFTITFGALPATNDLVHLVNDSLFWSQVRSEPEPWLAESAEPSEDGRVWTVRLRDGVVWHDGTPFTAEDVKFSFDYYEAQASSAGRYAHHVSDIPDYASSEVVDPLTVRLTFNEPSPQFKSMPGADLPILAKHVWEGVEDPKSTSDRMPVGTGPFKVTEMVADQRYVLEANDDYFKGRPLVDRLELAVIPEPAAAFAALRTGDVDMVERIVPPELLDQFRADPAITVAEGTRIESNQLYFNARKAPLDDPRLRKAMSLGIDVGALVDTVLLGNGRPGRDTFLHPDSPWAVSGGEHDFDPERANTSLDEAGYDQRDGDGVRLAPDGSRLDFSVLVSSFEPLDIRAVQLMAEQLAPIGVKLTAEPLEPTALRSRRQAPEGGGPPPYDLYISGLEAHAHVDPDALYYFFHSPGSRGFGGAITGYANPDYDALVERAVTADTAERKALDAQAQTILAEEVPAQVLWYPDGLYAYRPGAYDRWLSDLGQGIFTKRSFLTDYAPQPGRGPGGEQAAAASDDGGGGAGGTVLVVVLALVVVGALAAVVARRRRTASDEA